jgi:hypothetical protein
MSADLENVSVHLGQLGEAVLKMEEALGLIRAALRATNEAVRRSLDSVRAVEQNLVQERARRATDMEALRQEMAAGMQALQRGVAAQDQVNALARDFVFQPDLVRRPAPAPAGGGG